MLAKAKEAAAARVTKTKEAVKDVQTQLQVALDSGKSPAQQALDSGKSPAQQAEESGKSPTPQAEDSAKSQSPQAEKSAKSQAPQVEKSAKTQGAVGNVIVQAQQAIIGAAKARALKAVDYVKDVIHISMPTEPKPLYKRIEAKHAVYSRSWSSDLWLWLKNEHIVLSLVYAHPEHSFSPVERQVVLLISLVFGFGVTCLLNLVGNPTMRVVLSVTVAAVIQGVNDTLLKIAATCSCVQSCPRPIKWCFESVGKFSICLQACFAIGLCAVSVWALFVASRAVEYVAEPGFVASLFVASKLESFLLVTVLMATMTFQRTRHSHLKPIDPNKQCHVMLLYPKYGKVGSKLWDKWIGADLTFDDLPERAPAYPLKVSLCGLTLYEKKVEPPTIQASISDAEIDTVASS